MPRNDRLLRAARRVPVDRPPVWMMRQAGRYLDEYRSLRAKHSFLDLCRDPELAAEISLQPYRAFGMDGVIVFSDIMIALEGTGVDYALDDGGPRIQSPIRDPRVARKVSPSDPREHSPYVFETIRLLAREVGEEVPVIGFAGAPFTLAAYAIEGGGSKGYDTAKAFAIEHRQAFDELCRSLAETVSRHLEAQIEAGASIVQLFDTWAGELSPRDHQELALPYERLVLDRVRSKGVPSILYVRGCAGLLEALREAGADVLSLDWRVDLASARRVLGPNVAVQGNLDPAVLLTTASIVEERTRELVAAGGGIGHIVNLGHGVLPETPRENVRVFFETVMGGGSTAGD